MTVAEELQNMVADLSAAIAGRKPYGRIEQERLRKSLSRIAVDLRRQEAAGTVSRLVLEDLISTLDRGIADVASAVSHARNRAAVVQAAG